jgi:hypothetical protein
MCLRIDYLLDLVLDQDLMKVITESVTRGVTETADNKKWLLKHYGHRSQVKFGLKISFNTQSKLKVMGHVLMTKFGKSEKLGLSSFLFWTIRFW